MLDDPAIEHALPIVLAGPDAHRDLIIEADRWVLAERRKAQVLVATAAAHEVPGDWSPENRRIDPACFEIALDGRERGHVRISALSRVQHGVPDESMTQHPVGGRRGCEQSDAQRG